MQEPLIAAVLLALVFSTPGAIAATTQAAETDEPASIEFRPPTGDAEDGQPIVLSFAGRIYEAPLPLAGAEGARPLGPDEAFILAVVEANARATSEEVLELWDPDERSALAAKLADPELFERNQDFFRQIGSSALVARVGYGPFVLFVLEHWRSSGDGFVHVYPARRRGERLYLTNALQDDPILNFFYFVAAERLRDRPAEDSPGDALQNEDPAPGVEGRD